MSTNRAKQRLIPLPDIGDILFVLLLQIPLFLRPSFLFGDGSTGWHLFIGDYILATHSIPHKDLISYTFPQKAWVAYEWLSDVLMAWLVQLGGTNLLAVVMSCFIALLFLLLYDRLREEGANFLLALLMIILGALVSAVHWLARPVLFTFFGVYFFSTSLERFYRGTISSTRLTIILCLYMLLWVNTHPAWLVGPALIIIYLLCAIVSCIVSAAENRRHYFYRIRSLMVALFVVLASTIVNPYGLELHKYITHYLKGSTVLAATDEFASPIFHGGLQPVCLELLFFLFAIGLVISRTRLSFPRLMTCLAFAHLSLSAQRNMPLFVIVVLPAISQLFSRTHVFPNGSSKDQLKPAKWWQDAVLRWDNFCRGFDQNEFRCKMHLIPIGYTALLITVAMNGGEFFGLKMLTCSFNAADKPTGTLEYIHSHKLDPRHGMNYDNWGGYIKYKLGIPVFIDDRADFYGEPFYLEYAQVSQVNPGWNDILDKRRIDWLLFPNNSRIVAILKSDPGWKVASEDKSSVLMIRKKQTIGRPR